MTPALRYSRLRDIRASCHHSVIMALRAYFDDSGNFEDPQESCFVIGGFIAHIDNWDDFEGAWFEVLNKFNVSEFKASNLQCFDYEYKGWNECQRKAFLQELVTVMKTTLPTPSKPLAALLPKSQFDELSDDRKKKWGSHAYFPCLQSTIMSAGWHAKRMYVPSETATIVCDEEDRETQKIAQEVYFACKKRLPDQHFDGFGFTESHRVAGLQLADFVSYYAYQMCRRIVRGDTDRVIEKPWWPMERLTGIYMPEFDLFTHPLLSQREPLTDYSIPD